MILEPPEAPKTRRTLLLLSTTIIGDIEDIGLFPGLIKFALDGAKPNEFDIFGVEKSSIISLKSIPVRLPAYLAPKLF
jgi:hypothetical protein